MFSRLFLLSTLFLFAPDSRAQSEPGRFVRWALDDAKAYGMVAARKFPQVGIVTTGVLVGSRPLDLQSNNEVREWSRGPVREFLEHANSLGGPISTAPVLGLFAASLMTDNSRFQDAAFTSLQALIYSGLLTYSLKIALGRARPEDRRGPNQFNPFSGASSFPSGHTATAFAVITPWVLYYRSPLAKALFILPIGTAFARLDRDKHWVTDVVAGGTLGFLTARFLFRRHEKGPLPSRRSGPDILLLGRGASVVYRF